MRRLSAWGYKTMKKSMLAGVSALALAAAAPVNAWAITPALTWTGCYVGAHAGYGSGPTTMNSGDVYGNGFEMSSFNVDGGLVGGQIGCNVQIPASNFVVGVDFSMAGTNIKGTGLDGYVPGGPFYDTVKLNQLNSVTGRFGWNGWNPQLLIYVKGGAAFTKLSYMNSYFTVPLYASGQTRSGWTAGAGAEWAFTQKWSVFVEYNHYDFGTMTMPDAFNSTPPIPVKQTFDTVQGGVNYRFIP
jgi:outer membrane immunogenic protein